MVGIKQNTLETTKAYLRLQGAEHGGRARGFTSVWITENNAVTPPEEDGLIGKILCPYNLNKAYLKVCRNKGNHGVDGLKIESLKDYLVNHGSELVCSIRNGKYRPNPVRRVEIPKDGHSTRPLGIPTVVDRLVQQAIHQVLSPIYEQQFSDNSFGFRPKRSAHHALFRSKEIISEGYNYAVDMDMEKFFDTVNHSKLVEVLSRTIKDGRVIALIHKYLNAGVVVNHEFEDTEQGVPQGGPLSPLLSNIVLNELDKELIARGHRFVRYADDMVIFCRSKRAGERIKISVTSFIENRLFLKVNRDKTSVVYFSNIKLLGYSFYQIKGEVRFRIHPKSIQKMRSKIKELTGRSNGLGNEARKKKLSYFIKGWINYFKYADIKNLLIKTDSWYRHRLRIVIWKQWKEIRAKWRNLVKLGINKFKAWEYANTRKGYWHIANSYILTKSITNNRLCQAGYTMFSDYYKLVRV
ncbi:group II intron reverse transcriptase/maturase [Labilibacter sediminis]|nr:group II intron reverse transcriptase/maturase [Labilibacter sediminis]